MKTERRVFRPFRCRRTHTGRPGIPPAGTVLGLVVMCSFVIAGPVAETKPHTIISSSGRSIAETEVQGVIGPEWNDVNGVEIAAAVGTMKVLVKHDAAHLYLAFDVDDATRKDNDEVQIYLDTLHNGGDAFGQPDDRHYGIWRGGKVFGNPTRRFNASERTGGWQIECCIRLADLNAPGPGSTMGLRLYQRDTDRRHVVWPKGSYAPSTWGDLTLAGASVPPDANAVDGMVRIASGTFTMGSDTGPSHERPAHAVELDEYWIDRDEVSVAEFCEFLNGCEATLDLNDRFRLVMQHGQEETLMLDMASHFCRVQFNDGKFRPLSGYEDHPIVTVTWHAAAAYAQWAGKRLPTEAEWERAARGSPVTNVYPWGDTFAADSANYNENVGHTTAVGSYSANDLGLYDMAGNVWEWCADWYDAKYYDSSPAKDPTGPNSGQYRVVRGGSWRASAFDKLRCAVRSAQTPETMRSDLGFRCVRSP